MLKQHDLPDIWVAAGDGCSYLRKFRYLLKDLPSHGVLFNKNDRHDIEVLEAFHIHTYIHAYIHAYAHTYTNSYELLARHRGT